MCGICGMVPLDGPLDPVAGAALPAMCAALAHRGPDGEGRVLDDQVAFGHRRLAIIDRAGGAQPLSNEDGSCIVVFNGEVYNHRELRTILAGRGHVFRTSSDTEVIVHAYEEYGPACVEHLEGMFAFAVYDRQRRELFAARDRLGKKPLYFAVMNQIFHFASEIKALAASPAWTGAPDTRGLDSYLALGYFIAPRTAYRDVRSLEPGHYLRVRHGAVEIRKYWDVTEFDTDHRPESVLLAELDALLQDSVRDRLESEVPLGAFLSGGIDSGLVVSAMSQALATPPITAAVGFSHAAHNELQAAGQTAAHCQTKHFQHVIEPDLDKVLDPIVRSFDEPFADASAIPTYYVSAVARRHVTVALSGDGGDEAFGGYSARYVPHGVESIARDYWAGARGRRSAGWVGARWPRWRSLPRPLRLGGVLENLGTDAANAYYRDHCIMKPAVARRLVGGPLISDIADQPGYRAMAGPYLHCPSDAVQRAQYADLKTYLASNVLVKVDRMSMANSLEVRCPLLDRRIIELAFRIPVARKMPWLRPKHLLRRLARQRLPVQIQRRPKHGFTAPAGEWIAGACAWRFREEVLGRSSHVASWLDLGVVRGLFDGHTTGEADHGRALWAIWMLERWSRVTHGAAAHAAPAAVKECA